MTTLPTTRPLPEQRPFKPYGAARELAVCYGREVVLSGPAGTGKSRMCLERLHRWAIKCPGMRGLILRKTRESLTQAALTTFEEKVLPVGDPLLSGPQRNMRQEYRYGNGSRIVVGGLDKPQKVMSTEYDIAYVQEAIECTEEDWEMVTTRLRNGVMPFQQIMGDCNPDAPMHWLYQRCQRGQTLMLESRHEDNPSVTPAYLGILDALTGVRYKRLRLGLWVAAEGMVYEGWDPALHRINRFPIPRDWPRYWVVDFGFTNPFVCLWLAMDHDGRLYCHRQFYHTQRLVEDHARDILRVMNLEGEPSPQAIICDHDAEDRATLERHLGMATAAAHKSVSDGIQAVATRLRVAGDGKARLFFLRDSVVERDALLTEKKRPCSTEEEFDSYIWNETGGRRKGEEPVKENDHGMDALRYGVAHIDGLAIFYMPAAAVGQARAGMGVRG